MLSIATTIQVGDISTGLSANAKGKGSLFSPVLNATSPVLVAMVTDALRWNYETDTSDAYSRGLANYAYWIYGKFGGEAQYIIDPGGSVSPVTPGGLLPIPYDFEVSTVATNDAPIINGQGSITLDGTGGTRDFRGFNLIFNRNNIPQSSVNVGGSYFLWNRTTGLFQCFSNAVTTELFQIIPVG